MKKQLLLITCILALAACRKDIAPEPCTDPLDPNCVTYHPCNGVEPVTADFEMWGGIGFINVWYVQDSVFTPGDILFKAKLNGAQYRWVLGRDTEFVQQDYRTFYISPEDTTIFGTYYNTLTVWKSPNTSCYPNDQPTATLTRSITIKRNKDLLTSGSFRVKYEKDVDSTDIHIRAWSRNNWGKLDTISETGKRYLIGFKGVRDTIAGSADGNSGFFYYDKIILIKNDFNYDLPMLGEIKVDPKTLQITGNYEVRYPTKYSFKFNGRKL